MAEEDQEGQEDQEDQEDQEGQEDQEDQEELDAFADAISSGEGEGEEELDPLAEEMLKMMEEEGPEDEQSSQEDVDRLMEMEMLKAMEEEGGVSSLDTGLALEGAGGSGRAPTGGGGLPPNIARLMDVEMTVTIELGTTDKTLEEVLSMGEQSLVELDKQVGEPVDIKVNGKLFARGEVVTVSENFGVRITEIINPANNL